MMFVVQFNVFIESWHEGLSIVNLFDVCVPRAIVNCFLILSLMEPIKAEDIKFMSNYFQTFPQQQKDESS